MYRYKYFMVSVLLGEDYEIDFELFDKFEKSPLTKGVRTPDRVNIVDKSTNEVLCYCTREVV